MRALRFSSFTAAALFALVTALAPAAATACEPGAQACPCGAACPDKQMGCEKAPDGCAGEAKPEGEKTAGGCACAAAAAAAAARADQGTNDGSDGVGAARQRAVVDPETGQLTVPAPGSPAAADIAAEPSQRGAVATEQIENSGGGGVMAPFPKAKASKAVATLEESAATRAGSGDAAE